jgi:hypothetical protein
MKSLLLSRDYDSVVDLSVGALATSGVLASGIHSAIIGTNAP